MLLDTKHTFCWTIKELPEHDEKMDQTSFVVVVLLLILEVSSLLLLFLYNILRTEKMEARVILNWLVKFNGSNF